MPLKNSKQLLENTFRKDLLLLSLQLLPIIYIGTIMSVIFHEIVGHGLSCSLLGGTFDGFGILIDGMGYAMINSLNLSIPSVIIVLLGGIIVTTILAIVFFILSHRFRNNNLLSLTFLILAFTAFMDSIPYFFFDAIYIGGIGDYALIYSMVPSETTRYLVITLLGILMIGGIILFNSIFIKYSTHVLSRNKQISRKNQLSLFIYAFILQLIGWISFDWNQLIPGIGLIPVILGVLVTIVVLAGLFIKKNNVERSDDVQKEDKLAWKRFIIISWGVCFVLIATIIFWLQFGVIF